MIQFYAIGFHSKNKHLLKRFTDMHAIETFCGKILSGSLIQNMRGGNCKVCETKFQDLLDSIEEFKCNLCDFTTKAHFRRTEHYIDKHQHLIKSESDKAESKKWFTIIFKKKYHGHELVIEYSSASNEYLGSCICGKGKFFGVYDKILCHKQFTEHIRQEEVLPIAF